jgi:hypothetical protein
LRVIFFHFVAIGDLTSQGAAPVVRFGFTLEATLVTRRLPKKKGPACSVCRHEHRALIESTRLADASLDTIAAKYHVSRDSVHRHMKSHVPDDLKAELLASVPLEQLAAEAAREGLSVLQYLALTRSTLTRQMQLASSVNDHHATATVARALNETNRLIGAITGEMGELASRHINITNNNLVLQQHPEFIRLQTGLMRALGPFPEARAAVVDMLHELDGGNAPPRPAASANGDIKLIETSVMETMHVG